MPYYECVYLARQDIAANQVEQMTGHFKEVIEQNGGSVPKTEYWGLKSFAYRIKKNRKAHYILMNVECGAEALAELEEIFRFNDAILRHMTLRRDAAVTEASPMLKDKEREREREDDGGDRPRSRGRRSSDDDSSDDDNDDDDSRDAA